MKRNKKAFDAVEMMREIRDKMSADMEGMTFEEQREYIESRASRTRKKVLESKEPVGAA